jgi:hypothetical protein
LVGTVQDTDHDDIQQRDEILGPVRDEGDILAICSTCGNQYMIPGTITATCEHCGKDVKIDIPTTCGRCEFGEE